MNGKTFFVTGGNTGIGFATAKRFAREGANIGILSLGDDLNENAEREIRALGADCLAITGDVTVARDVEGAVAAVCDRFGGLHYAFNNVGQTAFWGQFDGPGLLGPDGQAIFLATPGAAANDPYSFQILARRGRIAPGARFAMP